MEVSEQIKGVVELSIDHRCTCPNMDEWRSVVNIVSREDVFSALWSALRNDMTSFTQDCFFGYE